MTITFNYEFDTLRVNFSSRVAESEQNKEPLLTMILSGVKVGFRFMFKSSLAGSLCFAFHLASKEYG